MSTKKKGRTSFNERPLHNLWQGLANGKYLIVIPKKGKPHKMMKPNLKVYEDLKENPEVKAVLTSGMVWDYRDRLIKKAKKNLHTVNDVIENYKKYFTNLSDNIWYLK